MFLYRLLSFFVNFFCAFLAVITFFGILLAFGNPALLLQVFLTGCTVLYGWFANRFFTYVVIGRQHIRKKQKDWLQVNAIGAIIFSILGIVNFIYLFSNPHSLDELLKQIPASQPVPKTLLLNVSIGLFVLCSLLFIHIIWTYILVRKHKEYFDN